MPVIVVGGKTQDNCHALRTPLTCPALGAATAGSGADHFVAAAVGAGDVHIHVAQGDLHAVGVIAFLAAVTVGNRPVFGMRRVRDDIDNFFLAGAR